MSKIADYVQSELHAIAVCTCETDEPEDIYELEDEYMHVITHRDAASLERLLHTTGGKRRAIARGKLVDVMAALHRLYDLDAATCRRSAAS